MTVLLLNSGHILASLLERRDEGCGSGHLIMFRQLIGSYSTSWLGKILSYMTPKTYCYHFRGDTVDEEVRRCYPSVFGQIPVRGSTPKIESIINRVGRRSNSLGGALDPTSSTPSLSNQALSQPSIPSQQTLGHSQSSAPIYAHPQPSISSRIGGVPRSSSRPTPYPVFNRRVSYRPQQRQRQQTVGRVFTRSVVVVDGTDTNVPRGHRRQYLHDKGLVIGFVEFNTGWSEDQVYSELERLLGSQIIDLSKPHPR